MIALIYFSGFFLVYYAIRYFAKKADDWTWSSFKIALLYAIFSWIGGLVALGIVIYLFFSEKIDGKPPKWL